MRDPDSYKSKDPEKRKRSLDNLNRLGRKKYNPVDEEWRLAIEKKVKDREKSIIGNRFVRAKRPLVEPKSLEDPEYRDNIVKFLNEQFYIETRKPIVIEDWQAEILNDIFHKDKHYSTVLLGLPKKQGKSTCFLAGINLWRLIYGPDFGEQYICCNDLEQGKSVVFSRIVRCIELNHGLLAILNITSDKVELTSKGNFIQVLPQDFSGSSGYSPSMVTYDELWGFQLESARRFFEVLCENPARPDFMTLIASHAGYEKRGLLWELYQSGLDKKNKPEDFYFLWSHEHKASWVTPEFLERQKNRPGMRPEVYKRFWLNEWTESELSFFMERDYLSCVNKDLRPVISNKTLEIWIGVDASVSSDTSCVVAVTRTAERRIRLVTYKIWKPTQKKKMDLDATVGNALLELNKNFKVIGIYYDPYQLHMMMTNLRKEGLPCREVTQTQATTIAYSQLLYELIRYRNIEFYPNEELREHIMNAEIKDSEKGFRIVKGGNSRNKIDLGIGLAMAAFGCVNAPERREEKLQKLGYASPGYIWAEEGGEPEKPFNFPHVTLPGDDDYF
ncbi:hypothetical protein ES695_03520 [Candidatus Atribacteria bacterium 1244-E10-H5-B2]|nr:MAG: hypothetical protein ES695_03520 [Candidatus Atribacteria bacterium 1244-E10-H5-B2]